MPYSDLIAPELVLLSAIAREFTFRTAFSNRSLDRCSDVISASQYNNPATTEPRDKVSNSLRPKRTMFAAKLAEDALVPKLPANAIP